ncbi:MAG: 3-isopropylmalate dehydratase small subunit [Alphaproteobacteria bacterium]|nr:3-isopropylmalate dehydratase small subunit [Alphaproteobacteria bacterium]MCB9928421.1 3-isopropylmalate dehydratase small subunit [Alphaproteobacteria bacterium]
MPQTPFTQLTAVGVPLDQANVDTDQVIPARFLKYPRDEKYRTYLFHDLRLRPDGTENPDFVLSNEPYKSRGRILVADRNFGCGSSRESAVYALQDWGFRAVIAPSFGDIFFNNSFKNGFLPIRLPTAVCTALRQDLHDAPGAEIAIDVEAQTVTGPDGVAHRFELDDFRKYCLLRGLDDIDFTLESMAKIDAFERTNRPAWLGRNA